MNQVLEIKEIMENLLQETHALCALLYKQWCSTESRTISETKQMELRYGDRTKPLSTFEVPNSIKNQLKQKYPSDPLPRSEKRSNNTIIVKEPVKLKNVIYDNIFQTESVVDDNYPRVCLKQMLEKRNEILRRMLLDYQKISEYTQLGTAALSTEGQRKTYNIDSDNTSRSNGYSDFRKGYILDTMKSGLKYESKTTPSALKNKTARRLLKIGNISPPLTDNQNPPVLADILQHLNEKIGQFEEDMQTILLKDNIVEGSAESSLDHQYREFLPVIRPNRNIRLINASLYQLNNVNQNNFGQNKTSVSKKSVTKQNINRKKSELQNKRSIAKKSESLTHLEDTSIAGLVIEDRYGEILDQDNNINELNNL